MAGRKITQLPTLTTPEATDKLVIVDVSDTSESPQGTSKQIAVSNLGLSSIESTTLDVSIADGVATVDGISGTWTPVITAITGGATVSAAGDGIYSRTGNLVTCSASIGVLLNESESAETTFELSLPIVTEFAGGAELFGSFSGQTRSQQGYFLNQINFQQVVGESKALVSMQTTSDTTEGSQWSFQFVIQYVII
jgi:hypothetical protein